MHIRLDDGRKFTAAERRKARARVATAIGELILDWSNLHEELAKLFVTVAEVKPAIGFIIWHANKSDRMQRSLIRELLGELRFTDPRRKTQREDLLWLLKKTDELADGRNSAAHAPFLYVRNGDEVSFLPNWIFGNRLANRIAGKDVEKICRALSYDIGRLLAFASKANHFLRSTQQRSQRRWPNRFLLRAPTLLKPAP